MYMAVRHKHLKLDQAKIDRVRRILNVKTEQEAIERALDRVLAEADILKATDAARSVGGIEDFFAK